MASEKEAAHEGQYRTRDGTPENVVLVHFKHLLLSYSPPPAAAPIFIFFFFFYFLLSYFFIAHKQSQFNYTF
jgi:hypothetical protein